MANKRFKSRKRNRSLDFQYKPDFVYFEGKIFDTLPGTRFVVRVDRSSKGLEPLFIEADLKTLFKLRRIRMIKGDSVTVEVNPLDIDPTKTRIHGVIVGVQRDQYIPPPKKQ
jgi:translation initiation factor IF-1